QPTAAAQAEDAFQHELGMNVTNAITTLEGDSVDVYLFKKAFGRPGAITANRIYLAVQEFLLSAVSYNSRFDSVQRGEEHFTAKERYGFDSVFTQELGECSHCHAYGNNDLLYDAVHPFRNNALDSARVYTDYKDPGRGAITGNPSDYGLFKAPSLRNVAVSGPYMHDARYKTLRQVIDFYSDSLQFSPYLESFMLKHFDKDSTGAALQHGGMHLSEYDKEALIDLINSMTDYVYLNNPDLKDPY
ncbi:MAG TPA: cytochrome c peroxidase, partial [Chitinophagales bacterium]|nr:cytochrome c peroxidase [Chitinophagales bacterium]